MAHQAQKNFFKMVEQKYPEYFVNKTVLDCGSLDVNGSLKDLFQGCIYTGVDYVAGKNVDIVSPIHKLEFEDKFDVVVSGEMLEHDEYWKQSIRKMYDLLADGGLLAVSAAGQDRAEHGTSATTGVIWGTSNDYYKNITEEMVLEALEGAEFKDFEVIINSTDKDIYFYGIKK